MTLSIDSQIFEWLVAYQVQHNLRRVRSSIDQGVADFVAEAEDEQVLGYDEATHDGRRYKSVLVIADGSLVDRLRSEGRLSNREGDYHEVSSAEDWTDYMKQLKGDGAQFYNKRLRQVTRINEFPNDVMTAQDLDDLIDGLPWDFLTYNGSVPNEEVGTRTKLGLKYAQVFDGVSATQIKATPRDETGLGLVTHFERGVLETFAIVYDPEHQGRFIDREKGLVGEYRRYELVDGEFSQVGNTSKVYVNQDGQMRYMNHRPVFSPRAEAA